MRQPGIQTPSRRILEFLTKFLCAWVLALAVIAAIPAVERWTLQATMTSLSVLAHLLRTDYVATGPYVTLAGSTLEMVSDCTSLMPTLAFWCAILAFPAPWPWKAIGMLSGALILWTYNLARVVALALIIRSHPGWFEFVHAYLWQTITMGVVLLTFIGWIRTRMRYAPA